MSKTKIYGTAIAIFAILIVLYVMNAMVGSSSGNAKTLRVLVESGSPAETVAKATASEFKDKTGYDVIIDPVPYNGMFDKLATEIKSGRIVHDVAALDVLWLPAFKHALAPLDAIATPEIVEDFLPTLRSGGTLDGKLYGFPMWVNCKVLIYRTDLFADEENKDQFRSQYGYELTPPTTWDEYRDVARFFTRDGMYGTAVFGSASGAPQIMAVIIVRRSKWATLRTSSTAVSSLAAVFDSSDTQGELCHSSDNVLLI